jgi:predicted HicB family RNase H-like nuclease
MDHMSDGDDEVVFPLRTKGDHLLTAEEVEELAAEAEAGYDLSQATRQYVGRPSLDKGVSPRVSFRLSQELYQAARARAERDGRSVSEIARDAMERYIRE